MKRLLALTFLALSTFTGCVDNDDSLVITSFSSVTTTNSCVADPLSLLFRSSGLLDVGIIELEAHQKGYLVAPIVENGLPDRSMGSIQRDLIQLTGFEVQIVPTPGNKALGLVAGTDKFIVPVAGGALMPAGGKVAVFAEVVPPVVALQLEPRIGDGTWDNQVMAHMRPIGELSGSKIVGGWVDFPVELCRFCLTNPDEVCNPFAATSSVSTGGCIFQQDNFTTCCCTKVNSTTKQCVDADHIRCGINVPSGQIATTDGGV